MRRFLLVATALLALGSLAACGGDDDDPSAGSAERSASEGQASERAGKGGQASDDRRKATGANKGKGAGAGDGARRSKRASGTVIRTAGSQFGDVLFDGSDRAIYIFDIEETDRSECHGDCARAWPPVLTKGEPRARGGADADLLGTTKRDDGATQVTYNGRPLYYYVNDERGQVGCHNVPGFGGLWLAVTPSGDAVQ